MKKLLLVLVLALFASMVVAWSPASISVKGKTWSEVKLTKNGLAVNMDLWSTGVDISGSANGVAFSLGLDLSYDASTTGLSTDTTPYIYDVSTGFKVYFNQLTLDTTDFAANWYASQAFQGSYSLGWFKEVDNGAWGTTSTMDFKKYGLSLGFQDGKAAAKATVDPLNIAAQVTLNALSFDKFAVEVSSEDIFAGLGFRVGFITGGSYTANVWYKNSIDLGVATADVDLYGRYSNFNGQYAGLIAHVEEDTIGGKLGAKVHYDLEVAALTIQARFDGSYGFGPASVDIRVGSGYYGDWDSIWWEEFHGNLKTNIKDLSGRVRATIELPFETELLTGPTIGIGGDYYLADNSWKAPVYFTGNMYDMLELKVGTDLSSVEDWYAYLGYYATF